MKLKLSTLLTLLFFFVFSNLVYGQQLYEEVLQLKNGEEYYGETFNDEPNKIMRIKLRDGSIREFKYEQVKKITLQALNKELLPPSATQQTYSGGSVVLTELDFNMQVNSTHPEAKKHNNMLTGRLTLGYRFDEHITLGVGAGVAKFFGLTYVPLFVDGRYNFKLGRLHPFVGFNIGPALRLADSRVMFLYNGALGLEFYLGNDISLLVSSGYKIASIEAQTYYGTIPTKTRFIPLTVGLKLD